MTQELVVREQREVLTLPDRTTLERKLAAIKTFQTLVQSQLVEGLDFGKIPGTQKPTLFKPGAEKVAKLLELADTYEVVSTKDWDKPFFEFEVKCRLLLMGTDTVVAEGVGECNSHESRYRYRKAARVCPVCGAEKIIKGSEQYGGGWLCWKKTDGCGAKFRDGDQAIEGQVVGRVLNEDIADQVNTLLKMAKKRAMVDAVLSASRLSDIFSQDMEDIGRAAADEAVEGEYREVPISKGTAATSSATQPIQGAPPARARGTQTGATAPPPTGTDPGKGSPLLPAQKAAIEALSGRLKVSVPDMREWTYNQGAAMLTELQADVQAGARRPQPPSVAAESSSDAGNDAPVLVMGYVESVGDSTRLMCPTCRAAVVGVADGDAVPCEGCSSWVQIPETPDAELAAKGAEAVV